MRHRIRVPSFAAFLALWALSGAARACDINVREAGFVTNDGFPYPLRPCVLCLVVAKRTPEVEAHARRIEKLCEGDLSPINLVVEVIALEEMKAEEIQRLKEDGIDPEKLPASMIARSHGSEPAVLWIAPGLLDEAGVRALALSPKRGRLQALLADTGNYAVSVLVPGTDAEAGAAAFARLKGAARAHLEEHPDQAVPILKIDRKDPAEELLLAELGMKRGGKGGAEPAVAIVFGKGRRLFAPLEGEGIDAENFRRCLAYLNHNASDCTEDAVFVNQDTDDLLLRWEPALEKRMLDAIAKAGVMVAPPWEEVELDESGAPVDPDAKREAP